MSESAKPTILVTDSLFIFPEHEQQLREAGYEVERLDKPKATEDELCAVVKGKVGYILGGIEEVSEKVIAAADQLKVISFTGSDWKHFVTGWEAATDKNIAITYTPGANSNAVAEYALSMTLAMMRNLFDIGRTGKKSFQTAKELSSSKIGIIGLGNVGSRVGVMLEGLGVRDLVYYSRTRKYYFELDHRIRYSSLSELLRSSDVIVVCASSDAKGLLGSKELASVKPGASLVSIAMEGIIDIEALHREIESGRIEFAAADVAYGDSFDSLPLGRYYCSNSSTAYNTREALKAASDMAVESVINILNGRTDPFMVNKK